jgi:hypothetical protein
MNSPLLYRVMKYATQTPIHPVRPLSNQKVVEAAFEPPSPLCVARQHGGLPTPTARLDVVDINLLLLAAALLLGRVAVVAVLVELEADALVALVAVRVRLVDLCVLGELAVGF